jgi:hypothetical protein
MSEHASAALPIVLCVLGALAPGCSRGQAAPSPAPPASAAASASAGVSDEDAPELGNVMVQVGRRFEIAGKAMVANRFELAEFEVGELGELFEGDVPRARLPKEGPTDQIRPMAKVFFDSAIPELQKAAASKDRATFATAFAHAAALCNACHTSAAKAFIQVPAIPGREVPALEVVPAPPAH